ncbi:unnamed protein product [Periconia digitata]|uniref:Uncharacterized protein n=1 Tax=Periconia digitata TaxID=1303443 RepID=A0A9W4XQX3_9PLEO|nr:unnamed protein product [Periconia digitata]
MKLLCGLYSHNIQLRYKITSHSLVERLLHTKLQSFTYFDIPVLLSTKTLQTSPLCFFVCANDSHISSPRVGHLLCTASCSPINIPREPPNSQNYEMPHQFNHPSKTTSAEPRTSGRNKNPRSPDGTTESKITNPQNKQRASEVSIQVKTPGTANTPDIANESKFKKDQTSYGTAETETTSEIAETSEARISQAPLMPIDIMQHDWYIKQFPQILPSNFKIIHKRINAEFEAHVKTLSFLFDGVQDSFDANFDATISGYTSEAVLTSYQGLLRSAQFKEAHGRFKEWLMCRELQIGKCHDLEQCPTSCRLNKGAAKQNKIEGWAIRVYESENVFTQELKNGSGKKWFETGEFT